MPALGTVDVWSVSGEGVADTITQPSTALRATAQYTRQGQQLSIAHFDRTVKLADVNPALQECVDESR